MVDPFESMIDAAVHGTAVSKSGTAQNAGCRMGAGAGSVGTSGAGAGSGTTSGVTSAITSASNATGICPKCLKFWLVVLTVAILALWWRNR